MGRGTGSMSIAAGVKDDMSPAPVSDQPMDTWLGGDEEEMRRLANEALRNINAAKVMSWPPRLAFSSSLLCHHLHILWPHAADLTVE